ncbi:hypothetical protein B0H19DRAFT_1192998 [Mycena capillaripes]|nr:hypothetical protein B0H19DRAFT_1192998 [Mycena capillaripes]
MQHTSFATHSLPTRIMQLVVHLLISTSTSFLAAVAVLKCLDFHGALTVVLGATLIFNVVVLAMIEIIYLLRHYTRSAEPSLLDQRSELDDKLKCAEEGRRLVLWEL